MPKFALVTRPPWRILHRNSVQMRSYPRHHDGIGCDGCPLSARKAVGGTQFFRQYGGRQQASPIDRGKLAKGLDGVPPAEFLGHSSGPGTGERAIWPLAMYER